MTIPYRLWHSSLLFTATIFMSLLVSLMYSAGALAEESAIVRWYSLSQVETGLVIYKANCAGCHGAKGEGATDWEQRDFLGFYPPPPLGGGGHSAHHPLEQLLLTVTTGGAAMGGTMPAFSDVLEEVEIHAVVAFFQSLWTDEIYVGWTAQNFETVSHH